MDKLVVDLGPVQQTLLIPLLGRAVESRKPAGLLKDRKAEAIVDALDYDFAKWRGGASLVGATLRTVLFDRAIEKFARDAATIVEIGCGLNTRFDRLDDGERQWLEFDLPDSIALRRRFGGTAPLNMVIQLPRSVGEAKLANGILLLPESPYWDVAATGQGRLSRRAAIGRVIAGATIAEAAALRQGDGASGFSRGCRGRSAFSASVMWTGSPPWRASLRAKARKRH